MKTCLISTVGISLYKWIERTDISKLALDPKQISVYLTDNGIAKRASAEIASIQSILSRGYLDDSKDLYLLTSDTEEGKISGEVIREYFLGNFQSVYVIDIKGLNTDDSAIFRDEGLLQLVKSTSTIIYEKRNKQEECIINATGGYKAQISFVGLIGQVLRIPVYYQFEDFKEIIKMPSMPISLDNQLWLRNYDLFDKLFRYGSLPNYQIDDKVLNQEELRDLLDESDGQYRLSSVGLLMHEVLYQRFNEDKNYFLPKENTSFTESFEKMIEFPVIPLALETMLECIANLQYVLSIKFVKIQHDFTGKTYFKRNPKEVGSIIGTYTDGRHTWTFQIETTGEELTEDQAVCVDLNLRFSNPYEKPKPKNVKFLLVRHGQHTGEEENRIEGWADFELTDTGKKQSTLLAERLKRDFTIDSLYSSSLLRAQQTAEAIGEAFEIKPIMLQDIRAMNYGRSGGLKKYEASVLFPKTRDSQFPHNRSWGRESELGFAKRVLEAFYEIYYSHPGETVAIVTHGRAISTILREVLRMPISQDFRIGADDTSIHYFEMGPDKTEIQYLNNTDHLLGLGE